MALVLAAALAAAIAIAAITILLSGWVGSSPAQGSQTSGVVVLLTFPGFEDDVKRLLCPEDTVETLVPPGVDPHEYQLKPSDIEKIKSADIIVSTAHTHFEVQVRRVAAEKGIELIEIPSIKGITILINPATGKPNLHGIIYHPQNYERLLTTIVEKASTLRPECREKYFEGLERLRAELQRIVEEGEGLGLRGREAIVETPALQYAIEWLGVRVTAVVQPEHNVPPEPSLVKSVEEAIAEGRVAFVAVVKGGRGEAARTAEWLTSIAVEAGVKVVYIEPPYAPGSMVEKLREILDQLEQG